MTANAAFLEMAQLSSSEQARGELLDRWLGRAGVDFSVALANLRQSGSIKLFATAMRGEYGASADVEVSAVSLTARRRQARLGFAIRNVEKRLSATATSAGELPRSMAQLTELIGRVPLRDLVRETTDVIEKLSHRGRAGVDRRQPRLGGRNARPQPAEPLRQASPLRA